MCAAQWYRGTEVFSRKAIAASEEKSELLKEELDIDLKPGVAEA